jgi:hypothetical protein
MREVSSGDTAADTEVRALASVHKVVILVRGKNGLIRCSRLFVEIQFTLTTSTRHPPNKHLPFGWLRERFFKSLQVC